MSLERKFLSLEQEYILGIYGGVGPLSHTQFEQLLLKENEKRGAKSDQDHPVWILLSATSTPDRTKGLLYDGENAAPHMIHFAKLIESAGADVLFVICNTSHAYHQEVQRAIEIPWVHLMRITAERIHQYMGKGAEIGILGTDGTLKTGLYHEALEAYHLQPVSPDVGDEIQKMIMGTIYDKEYGIKATGDTVSSQAQDHLVRAADWCVDQGAKGIILGCTEISVGLTSEVYPRTRLFDPLEIAAELALDIAYGKRKPEEFLIEY